MEEVKEREDSYRISKVSMMTS